MDVHYLQATLDSRCCRESNKLLGATQREIKIQDMLNKNYTCTMKYMNCKF